MMVTTPNEVGPHKTTLVFNATSTLHTTQDNHTHTQKYR